MSGEQRSRPRRSADDGTVTIVTQTRVRPESTRGLRPLAGRDQRASIAAFPGFIKQTVMPPSPPAQVDWVILQRFADDRGRHGLAQLRARGCTRVRGRGADAGRPRRHPPRADGGDRACCPSPVSAVISTRVKPGQEAAYRDWEQRIAAAQAKAPGFQGYRFEPPIPGVQDDWLAILRFDTEANLQAWLDSPERQKLLAEAERLHRGIPRPHRAHRLRPVVPGAARAARRRPRPGSRTCSCC